MPCGQKKKTSEVSQSQTVMPPEAEMAGTTLRLTMATTKSSTRSHRPRTRLRCAASGCELVDISQVPHGLKSVRVLKALGRAGHCPPAAGELATAPRPPPAFLF